MAKVDLTAYILHHRRENTGAGRKNRMMDVQKINIFTEVVVSTFETAFSMKPFRSGEFKRLEGDVRNPDDLMCILTFSGTLTGTLILTFPAATAKKIYSALMFEEPNALGDEVKEAFTEIMSMIAGNVRAKLSTVKFDFDHPMIATGSAKYENVDKFPWLYVPMGFKDWGRFNMLLAIKET